MHCMNEITIPKLNNNDTEYVLLEWLHDDGAEVEQGAAVAVVETSKATEEILSDRGGILHQGLPPMGTCAVGAVIGRIFATAADYEDFQSEVPAQDPGTAPAAAEVVITAPAREAAARLGIDLSRLATLGKKVVKAADVENLAAANPTTRMSRMQRAIADVVSESHRQIPAAFVAMRVTADPALTAAAELTRVAGETIGLPELLIAAIGRARAKHGQCFSSFAGDGTIRLADGAQVGVTIDTGSGLFLPVVRDADRRPVAAIAAQLMNFRIDALRESLRAGDLDGANIALSLHYEPDIVVAQPIVFPGHGCIVSLPGVLAEPHGADGVTRYLNLGLTYDHRVINGREAVAFLRFLKTQLEDAETVTSFASGPTATP